MVRDGPLRAGLLTMRCELLLPDVLSGPAKSRSVHPSYKRQILDPLAVLRYERAMFALCTMLVSSAVRRRTAGPGALRMR
jgi:hypothetical protein